MIEHSHLPFCTLWHGTIQNFSVKWWIAFDFFEAMVLVILFVLHQMAFKVFYCFHRWLIVRLKWDPSIFREICQERKVISRVTTNLDETKSDVVFAQRLVVLRVERWRRDTLELVRFGHPLHELVVTLWIRLVLDMIHQLGRCKIDISKVYSACKDDVETQKILAIPIEQMETQKFKDTLDFDHGD